jgi:CHAT domain-containing protein/tetratricopeptide (TPR) repeat protein
MQKGMMIERFFISPFIWRKSSFRLHIFYALLGLCWLLSGTISSVAGKQTEAARELLLNTPVERQLQVGETHLYKITLASATYLRIFINPSDTAVNSKITAPGGTQDVGVRYYPSGKGARFVSLIAEAAGIYNLEIRLSEQGKAGSYTGKIEELRPATAEDRVHLAAEKAEEDGRILGDTQQGAAKYEEALALWRKLGDQKGELRMLAYLGNKYKFIGEVQIAADYHKQAIEAARRLGDRYREATLMLEVSSTYLALGENQKALDTYNQARQIFKSLSKRYGEALATFNIGYLFFGLGEWENALPYLEETLPTFSSLGDIDSECTILNAMGKIYRVLGDSPKGIGFHNRALTLARNNQYADTEAICLRHLGDAYLELDERQKALEFYEQSLKLSQKVGMPACEGDGLRGIGYITYLSGDYPKALDFLTRSLARYRAGWERSREAKALHNLALVNYALGNFDDAKNQIEQAITIQESLRANIINQQLRDNIFSSAQSTFALYIGTLMQLHKKNPNAGFEALALQVSERARARSLLDLLSISQANIREGVPQNLLDLERTLQQQLNAKAAARARVLNDKRTQAQAAAFDKEIAQLSARFRDVEVQIRQSSPRYAALTKPQPLSAQEIQQQLDDQTVLLEFALGEKQSWLWAVTRTSVNSYQLSSSNEIEPAARKVYELLTVRQPKKGETEAQYKARVTQSETSLQNESARLSRLLLAPIATRLQSEWKDKRLAIVASGTLEYIPFAALPLPQATGEKSGMETKNPQSTEPLIARHEIINLPSVSALAAIRRETSGRKTAEKTVAVIADPVFEPTDPRVLKAMQQDNNKSMVVSVRSGEPSANATQAQAAPVGDSDLGRALRSFDLLNERGGFSRLPFSREEAEAIATLAGKTALMKATDFQATRTVATSGELARFRILHFATHGLLNSERPELSGLVLSLVDEHGKSQDGFLRMHEIYNLHLPAELIVLSACQTALGKQIRGEGLVGLTRGFMYAGAERVVASLWQVDDLATAELMKRFYRAMLKDGMRPAQALRAAQLEMMKQERWASPYFWAAFTIQGEWK